MAAREAGALRMMATLGTAGLCSGLAIVGIFLITLPRIEENRARALESAIFQVLEGARKRTAFVARGAELLRLEDSRGRPPGEETIYAGYDDAGRFLGWAIPAEGPGFQDTIKLIYGYDPERRRVVGMRVLESRETPGLGDKIIKDESFLAGFRDLAITPRVVSVKRGRKGANEVDAISGATISSAAVVRIINQANERWVELLPAPAGSASKPTADALEAGS